MENRTPLTLGGTLEWLHHGAALDVPQRARAVAAARDELLVAAGERAAGQVRCVRRDDALLQRRVLVQRERV